jgi:hypothetical protein
LPESIEWKSEIRIAKLETNPNNNMIKIRNLFKMSGDLNLWLVSDFGFRTSNFACGTSSGNVQQNEYPKIPNGTLRKILRGATSAQLSHDDTDSLLAVSL